MSIKKLQAQKPILPISPYVGGKSRLFKRICPLFLQIPHETYAEPFVGMGGIFLRRDYIPKGEVINDYNGDLINLFRIIQNHLAPFCDMMRYQLSSRREFQRILRQDPTTLTDMQRAATYLYRLRTCFGGKVTSNVFGVAPGRTSRFDPTKVNEMVIDLHDRLHDVTIENLPYQNFIPRYDRPATLFYLDPPYHGSEDYYGKEMFSEYDFNELAKILKQIKGAFIMSINDTSFIRGVFKSFYMHNIKTTYSLSASKNTDANELIITNKKITLNSG